MSAGAHRPEATAGSQDLGSAAFALLVALLIHSAAAVAISRVGGDWRRAMDTPVEIDVNEPPPPPPPELQPEPPPPEPPPLPAPARIVPRRLAQREPPTPVPSSPNPPPPNQLPPPNSPQNAPPVFGVTMSSVVSGDAAMAVPVGNTTMTKARSHPTIGTAAPYAGDGTVGLASVPDIYLASRARLLYEVDSEDVYPAQAKTLGIEGSVEAVLTIDENGSVVAVKITKRAGHGFDEAASAALKQFRYGPARTSDGRAVRSQLAWKYTFTVKN